MTYSSDNLPEFKTKNQGGRKYYKAVIIAFSIFSMLFFLLSAVRHFSEIPKLPINSAALAVFFLSLFFVVVNACIGAFIWRILLVDCGENVPIIHILRIFLIAQLGKYLPGNMGQHVGRVVMAKEAGFPLATVLGTIVVETLWNISVGIGLAVISLLFFTDSHFLGKLLQMGPAGLFMVALLLMASPWIGVVLINRWFPNIAHRLSGQKRMPSPQLGTALVVAILFILSFLTMGLILHLQAQYFFGSNAAGLIKLTCLFAVAWLGGYLMPGAPGGLGVRESLIVLLFTPFFGAAVAVGLGITLRVTTTVGDACAFLFGLLLKHLERDTLE